VTPAEWTSYDSGWETGHARAVHDLSVCAQAALALAAQQSGPYGQPAAGAWDRGYVHGYSIAVRRWLR